MPRVYQETITPATIKRGRKLLTKQRRENAEIDKQATAWRKQWQEGDPVPALLLYIDGDRVLFDSHVSRALVNNGHALPVGSFDAVSTLDARDEDAE